MVALVSVSLQDFFCVSVAGWVTCVAANSKELGVWFVPKGDVVLTGESWRLVVALDVSELAAEAGGLRSRMSSTTAVMEAMFQRVPALSVQRPTLARIRELEDQVDEVIQTLRDFLPHERNRRGLFNVGGKVMRWLFGTAEQEEMDVVHRGMEALKSQTGSLLHVQQEHLTLTRRLSRTTAESLKEVHTLYTKLEIEFDRVVEWSNRVEDRLELLEHTLTTFINASTVLTLLEFAVTRSLTDLRRVLTAVEEVSRGKLTVNIVSPLELSKVLERVSSALPIGSELLSGTDITKMYHYYEVARTSAVAVEGLIKIIVTLPLSSPGRLFQLFQAVALPVMWKESGLYTRLLLKPDHLLISTDHERYALLRKEEVAACSTTSPAVCPASHQCLDDTRRPVLGRCSKGMPTLPPACANVP